MKISTLEMIHETLKNEYEMARVSYADALKETARCEGALADAADEKAAVEAEKKLDASKKRQRRGESLGNPHPGRPPRF